MKSQTPHTLLVIDDDRLFSDSVRAYFAADHTEVLAAHSIDEARRICNDNKIDVVLLDQNLPDGYGVDLCPPILAANEQSKIIFITAYPSFDNAVKAVRNGAYDYLSKPIDPEELKLAVEQAFRTAELERVEQIHKYTTRRDNAETALIGSGTGLDEVRKLIRLSAQSDVPTLITGETGTGKNVVAKTIHYLRAEKAGPFIGINCASLPENLIEAELFGYEKGAFTGAAGTRKGIFEMAEGGTLFLDEIGELPLHLQSKLLGVVDDKQLKRLGGQTFKKVQVRLVAATNLNLEDAVRHKRFREDLYYRLSVLRIHIPPLRERTDDIPDLCSYFIKKSVPNAPPKLPEMEIQRLMAYPWPGNVRELKNIIERAIIFQEDGVIQLSKLLDKCVFSPPAPLAQEGKNGSITTLAELEKHHIQKVLAQMDNNHTHTARALNISRSTLLRKLKDYHIPTNA